jgi:Spy/CpxP family protein refolding chaperone
MSERKEFGVNKLEKESLLAVSATYSDHLDDHGHVHVTRWGNGEGFFIEVNSGGGHGGCDHQFSLTDMQWRALRKIMRAILRERNQERRRRRRRRRRD